jgi:hypothetical protein
MTEQERQVYEAETETDLIDSAGGLTGASPEGRAHRPGGGAPTVEVELPPGLRDRLANELIDNLLAGAGTEEEIVAPGGVLAQLTCSADSSTSITKTRNEPNQHLNPLTFGQTRGKSFRTCPGLVDAT